MTRALLVFGLAAILQCAASDARAGFEQEQRIVCLGDSYTVGEGVARSERWPERLALALAQHGIPIGAPQVIARTGWTADDLLAALDHVHPTGPRPLVTVLAGVNDQYRGRPTEDYRPSFRRVLERAVGLAGGASRVVVISIPDWSVSPFAADRDRARIAAEIDAYNAVNREEASRAGARWVDITDLTRAAGADPSAYADDGLHPSGEMYARWLARLVAALPRAPVGE